MKVRDLKEWLKKQNDEDIVCEIEAYGYCRELDLNYITLKRQKVLDTNKK